MYETMTDEYQRGFDAGERSYRIYIASVLKYVNDSLKTRPDDQPKMALEAILNLLDEVETDNNHS